MAKPGRKPGTPKTGGRRPGTPNKVTRHAKEILVEVIDNNAGRLQEWLDAIAKNDGPREAFRAFASLIEFSVPKLARNELTSGDGPQEIVIKWMDYSDDPPKRGGQ
jgi:hypothetical protein